MTRFRTVLLLILMCVGALAAGACDIESDPVVIREYHAPVDTLENQ